MSDGPVPLPPCAATRWQRVKGVLALALERPVADRTAFARELCGGDTGILREVAGLLAQTTTGLNDCAVAVGTPVGEEADGVDPHVGRRVGAWTLGARLGAGGMGTVYLARRADGAFEQTAAVKLLRRGTDTEEVLRRFRAERQILARLDHPGIVRLLDGGATDDGLPFFVLERVEGEPVTLPARRLDLPGRLRLFLKICAAVQYAHERLIVHRDLKPSNILVTAEGEPKLLDFGIAKLLEADGADTEHTLPGQGRLTPGYASPEQARGEPVTTASDVYALGALLYELLVGHSPHRFTTARPGRSEIARVVGEVPAVRPSLAAADPLAGRALRGDLDNILLKALEKDPARRYPTVNAMAEDVRRSLDGRPVRARPSTLRYRTAKFARRNKTLLAAVTTVAAVLAGGIVSTAWQARRAERRYREVRLLTNSYLFEIHDAIRDLPGSTPARRLLVSRALEYLNTLSREAMDDRSLRLELAAAYLQIGDVQGKPYTPNLGDSTHALLSYAKAIEIATPLAAAERGPESAARRVLSQAEENLGNVQARLDRWEQAVQNHRRALSIRRKLISQDPAHANEWRRGIVANDIGLGDAVISANRFRPAAGYQRSALAYYRRALTLCDCLMSAPHDHALDSPWMSKTCSRIATVLSEIGAAESNKDAFEESAAFHRRALALNEAAVAADPTNTLLKRRLADELIATAYLLAMSKEDLADAAGKCHRALALTESLAALDPANAEARQDLSSVFFVTGRVCQAQGNPGAASENYRRSEDVLRSLIAEHPGNIETTFDLARVRQGLSEVGPATSGRLAGLLPSVACSP